MKSKIIFYNLCFAANCLLVFLLLFESRIVLPSWLQVAGRLHPMILHFPIVCIVLYLLWVLFFSKKNQATDASLEIGEWLLLFSALSSAVTALAGFLLSREEGYDPDALQWHKWGGVAISVFTLGWYSFRKRIEKSTFTQLGISVIAFAAILFTGHQGAGITHGQNFLLAPIMPEKKEPVVLLEDAELFANVVRPILRTKCMGCHNDKKAKGQLVMETEEFLLKGGKSGKLWDSTEADYGLMLKRIHLPLETKKHMPPQGKPQLTAEEIEILNEWIKSGADFKIKVLDLAPASALRIMAEPKFITIETDDYDFDPASEKAIQTLNTNYRIVYPLAKESPALAAELFSASQFKSENLNELLTVRKQLVSLNLNKMPLQEEDLKTISQFSNLRKLNLSFTGIKGTSLAELNKLKKLKHLSLSGNPLNMDDLKKILSLPEISKLFLWNTGLKAEEIKLVTAKNKNLLVETGFFGDTLTLKLTAPLLQNEEQIIVKPVPLKLKHYINGVMIRYTLDGTEPDSLKSPVYNNDVTISSNVELKAKAFKPGWHSSDLLENNFYAVKYKPDSLVHILPPDAQYADPKGKTLIDLIKGDFNFRSGKWIAFRNNRMETLLSFNQPSLISSFTMSTLIDIGSFIMPPSSIEVWGGDYPNQLKLLKRINPEQPTMLKPAYLKGFDVRFSPTTIKYLKIIATPVLKLPKWHPGKGDKGWIFTDEVFVN